jgi:hypothetical protein
VICECRIFQEKWTGKYAGCSLSEKALCLIYSEGFAVLGEYNIARYYNFEMQRKVQKLCQCSEKGKKLWLYKRG